MVARAMSGGVPPEHWPATDDRPALEIHRSERRRRTSAARLEDDRIVVRLPAGLSVEAEHRAIGELVRKVTGRARREAIGGDQALQRRADLLADRYLDGVRAASVAWSGRMRHRYGSCAALTGTIRISDVLAGFPRYVLDAVLVHELAHLQQPNHSPAFHALTARFPRTERADGYLDGYAAGRVAGLRAGEGQPLGSLSGGC